MNKIKFSHDYLKLPVIWEGTQAILIGIQYIPDMDRFKKELAQLVRADTMFRGEDGFYPLNFKEGIILIFFHLNSCELFTTIRRFTLEKFQYYEGERQERFELMRAVENDNKT
jgi:hypothetical protein